MFKSWKYANFVKMAVGNGRPIAFSNIFFTEFLLLWVIIIMKMKRRVQALLKPLSVNKKAKPSLNKK